MKVDVVLVCTNGALSHQTSATAVIIRQWITLSTCAHWRSSLALSWGWWWCSQLAE